MQARALWWYDRFNASHDQRETRNNHIDHRIGICFVYPAVLARRHTPRSAAEELFDDRV